MQPITQLAEYQLLEKLGEGGMGVVYKALHTKLKRMVAVKILPKDRLWDEHAVVRFEREMVAVGALDHPNIVRAMDARELEGTRFLVMEYVDGMDLNALGRACDPLPIADASEIVRQAALGLEHAHQHGLVHRDVKCSNLMVTREGVLKILDLGLARFQFDPTAGGEVTGTGQAMGTVDYMAPEQVSDSRSVDIRADIYSLGCTFYKLLTGRTPFGGPDQKSLMQRLTAHATQPVPPIRQFRADVPEKLAAVLGHMLAKHPSDRFATPAEVTKAVGPFAAASNLSVLVARAQGQPVPEPSPTQSMLRTQEIPDSSSGFKRLMQEIVEDSAPSLPRSAARKRATRMPLALVAGLFGAGLICLAGVLVLAFKLSGADGLPTRTKGPSSTGVSPVPIVAEKTYLVLQWPAEERQGAMLHLDGQAQDMDRLALLALGGEIRLPITPGEHKLVINRLGYEPFEQSFTVSQGKDVKIRPTWKELAPAAEPPVGQASPPGSAVARSPDRATDPTEGLPKQATVAKPAQAGAEKAQAGTPMLQQKAQAGTPVLREDPEAKRQEELAARFAKETDAVEKLAAAWDFRGAAGALANVRFEEKELQERLAQRRGELKRMHDLKQKIVAAINAASPPLKKSALAIKGLGGDVVKADDEGITCKLINGKSESYAWGDIGAKATPKLVQLVVRGTGVSPVLKESTGKMPVLPSADDWIAAGLLGLVGQDPTFAERSFEQARGLGANIDPYLIPLAAAAFARAKDLLDKKQFTEADAALANLEGKYAGIPWFASNKQAIATARDVAKTGIVKNEEAENLYAEAARLFHKKELFDVKALVEKLKSEYADTGVVRDLRRKPTFFELEKAVARVRKAITVRLDGKGDFKSIQAAIDAAPPSSLIEIEDDGPYHEKVLIPKDKYELRLRGKKGCWPVITSADLPAGNRCLVTVEGAGAFLERLVLLLDNAAGLPGGCVAIVAGDVRLRWAIINGPGTLPGILTQDYQRKCECEECLVTVGAFAGAPCVFRNCLFLGSAEAGHRLDLNVSGCELQCCTILSELGHGGGGANRARDSIVGTVRSGTTPAPENCALLAGQVPAESRGCFKADPMFVDPKNFDYRLKPGSPCIGKASDGGDIGCRYTPEMIELCKQALELRRRGILKF